MARSVKKSSAFNERQAVSSGDIRDVLTKTRIAPDLLAHLDAAPSRLTAKAAPTKPPMFNVIIQFHRSFPGGINTARLTLISAYLKAKNTPDLRAKLDGYRIALAAEKPRDDSALVNAFGPEDTVAMQKSMWTDNYIFARLSRATIGRLSDWTILVPADPNDPHGVDKNVPLVFKIWQDHKITRCVHESARTVKCDAARTTFGASGKGIVWAVADTGIDATHPHFQLLKTTKLEDGLRHKDFTQEPPADDDASEAAALTDQDGHGTHVAGIIAGFTCRKGTEPRVDSDVENIMVKTLERVGASPPTSVEAPYHGPISGVARECTLMSLKVLKNGETGDDTSNLLAAIGYIQKCNGNGSTLKIHGLNISLGYPFDPEWFAAGKSPLCVEVDRLVRSGVCVVVAAGNAGYGVVTEYRGHRERAAHMGTITDPGNASLAITVGSTHREKPHSYGVSYFSAKGPTADGRMKPDLVAPGEHIKSCALMDSKSREGHEAPFREDSGTSMAAPHVSGAIAAFLSVRNEFKGDPETVKEIIMRAATDLKRREEFQGAGLLDLMRALQSV